MVNVVIHTEVHPEDNAMLQALYSRSAESVTDHIEKLRKVGSGKFMSQFYLGYGHASIADCGFITLYVEGLSMLAAKAIQDDELYNGQESSSRYIDWTNQPFINPYSDENSNRSDDAEGLLQAYRQFYVTQKPVVIEHLKGLYARKEQEKESVYEKAITAKAFDILRGYLPCGASTNVAWTTSLRKANERLASLALHPLVEVRSVAAQIHAKMIELYPNSIAPLPDYETADPYLKHFNNFYVEGYQDSFEIYNANDVIAESYINHLSPFASNEVGEIDNVIHQDRPKRARLMKHTVGALSRIVVQSDLDFGSFRDLQRHRANYCGMHVVSAVGGMHEWYYDQLPESSKLEADKLFEKITAFVNNHVEDKNNDLLQQYVLPMGTTVPVTLEMNVRQAVYLAELRSGQTVHATLRPLAQELGKYIEDLGIKTYCDYSEDEWNIRRGTQDIVTKTEKEKE